MAQASATMSHMSATFGTSTVTHRKRTFWSGVKQPRGSTETVRWPSMRTHRMRPGIGPLRESGALLQKAAGHVRERLDTLVAERTSAFLQNSEKVRLEPNVSLPSRPGLRYSLVICSTAQTARATHTPPAEATTKRRCRRGMYLEPSVFSLREDSSSAA